jgi:hypothetical protein
VSVAVSMVSPDEWQSASDVSFQLAIHVPQAGSLRHLRHQADCTFETGRRWNLAGIQYAPIERQMFWLNPHARILPCAQVSTMGAVGGFAAGKNLVSLARR